MQKISVKNKVIFTSVIALIYYLFSHRFFLIDLVERNNLFILFNPVVLSVLIFVGCIWLLNAKSGLQKYSVIVAYCCVNIFAFTLFSEALLINQSKLGQISTTLVFSILICAVFYVHLLTANIINYSHIRDIPLVYAARATAYIISLLSEYLIFFMTINAEIDLIIKMLILTSVSFFHCYFLLDSIKESMHNKLYSSTIISLVILLFGITLAIWPVSSEIKAIILTLIMYISVGISLEIKERINKSIWVEYIVLIASIILLLIFLSNWGINGHLL